MKYITKSGIFICLISFGMIPFTTSVGILQYFLTLGLILWSIISLLRKKDEHFITSLIFLFLASIYVFALYDLNSKYLIYAYFFGYVLICLHCYYYVMNKINNKMNLEYNKIKIPENEEYLTCKYLTGLDFKYHGNAIITKDQDTLYIQIEHEKAKDIFKHKITTSELKSIVSTSKPYIVGKFKRLTTGFDPARHEHRSIAPDADGTLYTKDIKPIESFQIEINLLNGQTIQFLSFNNPEKFFK